MEQTWASFLSPPFHPHGVASLGPQACETNYPSFWKAGWGWGGKDRPASTSLLEWRPGCIPDSLLPPCGCRASCRHTTVEWRGGCLCGCVGGQGDSERRAEAEVERSIPCVCSGGISDRDLLSPPQVWSHHCDTNRRTLASQKLKRKDGALTLICSGGD